MTTTAADAPASTAAADRITYRYEQLRGEGRGHRRTTATSMAFTIVRRQGVAAWLHMFERSQETSAHPQDRFEPAPAPAPSCPDLLNVLTNLVFQAHGEGSAHE